MTGAEFLFFLEGVALLRVAATLRESSADFKTIFNTWEGKDSTYQAFNHEILAAGKDFVELAEARLESDPDLDRRKWPEAPWIYPIYFSSIPSSELMKASGSALTFRGVSVDVVWRSATIGLRDSGHGLPAADRIALESVFIADALAWQSLFVLDRFLSRFLQAVISRPLTDEQLSFARAQRVRNIQFVGRYVSDASQPLSWTIRGEQLKLMTPIDSMWKLKDLRESVESKISLVALHSDQMVAARREREERAKEEYRRKEEQARSDLAKAENDRAKSDKKQSDRFDRNLKILALILTGVSLYSAVTNFITLLYKSDPQPSSGWNWRLALLALVLPVLVIFLAIIIWLRAWSKDRKEPTQTPVDSTQVPRNSLPK